MKIKVNATYYVEAPTWIEAEQLVEQNLSTPDTIESEPAGSDPRDMVAFAIANKIYSKHNKIFFETDHIETYEQKLEKLKAELGIWIDSIVEDVIKTNEEEWV